jgi:multisubunit Na+/H+ antiporter MnhE subunit
MTSGSSAGPLAGEPRDRGPGGRASGAARVRDWLGWWVVLMALWVILDDSLESDELLAGAGAAVIAATVAELAMHQAGTRFDARLGWFPRALRLPGQVLADTWTVYAALWRLVVRREQPDSAFVTEPVRYGDNSPRGVTRRTLLIGARSLAPNQFVLGMDAETDTLVIHKLVGGGGR